MQRATGQFVAVTVCCDSAGAGRPGFLITFAIFICTNVIGGLGLRLL
jgi:hypothetical protein